jgi:hypothetical protein
MFLKSQRRLKPRERKRPQPQPSEDSATTTARRSRQGRVVEGRIGEENHRESSFEAEQQEKTHATPEWFKGHCVGFESVPEAIAFAE